MIYLSRSREVILGALLRSNLKTSEVAKLLNIDIKEALTILTRMTKLNLVEVAWITDKNCKVFRITETGKLLLNKSNK